MRHSRAWTAALLVAFTIPMAADGGMTSGSGASRACATALRDKVRAEHPNSGRVEVLSDSEKKKAGSQTAVTGTARVETHDAGWRRLTFDCLYSTRGEAASVRYDIGGSAGGGSDAKATPTYVCKRAVAKRIHNDHPASGKIRWLVSSIAEQPAGNQTNVTGAGRIQTQDGYWRKFTFDCTYDNGKGRATHTSAKFT